MVTTRNFRTARINEDQANLAGRMSADHWNVSGHRGDVIARDVTAAGPLTSQAPAEGPVFAPQPGSVIADAVAFSLALGNFSQNWTNTALIGASDDWSGVPSIVGYRGDGQATGTGADPQTVTGADLTAVVDVNANQTNVLTFNTGGVTEFQLTNPTIALAGSSTAKAPYIVIYLDSTGRENVTISFTARDLEGPGTGGTMDNAVQQIAVQYRTSPTGTWINLPAGYIADATTGPNLNGPDIPVSVLLPAAAANSATLQIRILTTDAVGNDEWVGIDDIVVSSTAIPAGETQTVVFNPTSVAQVEGDSGTTAYTFTVTRTGGTTGQLDFSGTIAAGSTDNADYVGGSAPTMFSGSILAGQTSATVTVNIQGDVTIEGNESFSLTLTSVTNADPGVTEVIGANLTATGTITNDDVAPVPGTLSINDVTIVEGDTGPTSITFTVTRSSGDDGAVGATWTLNAPGGAGNADSGDFTGGQPTTGTVAFADGEITQTITILVQGDNLVETDENFTVTLSAATGGASLGDASGAGTITNDDAAGSLSIGDRTLAEGNSGTTAFSFTVLRSSGSDGAVGASWTLDAPGGTNLADLVDFAPGQPTSGTVSFADGETSQTIIILVQGDVTFEDVETFLVTLSAPTGGATLGNANGTGTINNDDAAPAGTLSIDDVSHSEGDNGSNTTFTFTVTRSAGTAGPIAADWTISASGGSGIASTDDFVSGAIFAGTVAFADGEISKTISIDVEGDVDFEADETFTVTLSNATGGAGIGDGTGTGTIVNDDLAPPAGSVGIADVSIAEGNAGTSILTVTLTRIGGTAAFDVNYATSNGGNPNNASATAGSDYVAASGLVSFAAGQTFATIQITINGDTTPELSEEFTVTLSGATNGATLSDSTAIATITNDDVAPGIFSLLSENFDSFRGTGFSPTPTSGQLDSDVYIASGFDDPANPSVNFGGTVTTGDLARGVTTGPQTSGGIYALNQGGGDHAFLVQPGGDDFTPGDFTIRIVNGSGLAADTFAVAYDLLVRNDQPRGNSFNLSYSTDGVTFFALTAFNYTSPAAADTDGLVTVARSGQFTTASSVAAGGFLYLRFTGNDVNGSGSRDEFGLDNVTVGAVGGAPAPQVSVSDVSVNEAAGTMTFTITRSNMVGGAFSVAYATADGTATAGSDYTATSGTLNFADNQVSATVTVAINNDGTPEFDETLLLNLSNPTGGAIILDNQAVGTIVNDDGTPIQVSINDVSIVEGNAGTSILTFTVTRTGGTGAFDVNFQTQNGTAVEPGDYAANSGTLSFAAGQNSQTISITINGDLITESNETFQVLLSGATNDAILVDGAGTGTIINDEPSFIHDIQGTSYYSPILAGDGISGFNIASTTVVTVRAVVTAVDNVGDRQGYYLSEEITDWDGNSYTSEGIFVMTRDDDLVGSVVSGVSVGDLVQISAQVMEYQAFNTMPRTMLVNSTGLQIISAGNALPTITLTNMPNEVMTLVTPDYSDSSDGVGDTFDASLYALSYFETVEGMLVTIPNMVVADGFVSLSVGDPYLQAYSLDSANPDQINSRGGYTIAGDPPIGPPDTPGTGDDTHNGGRVLHDGDINPDIIELDFTDFAMSPPTGLTQNATMGEMLGDVTGIIDFDFTDRKLFVTSMEPGGFVDSGNPVQETTLLGDDSRALTVATFNVENLDPTDGAARFTALANAIANNLNAPDIVCIEEMQDNDGVTGGANGSSVVDASTTWQMLVDALNLATGAHYQWVDQNPNEDAEGGAPGGNIRVGFLYNTDRVQLGDLDANASLTDRRKYTDRIGDNSRDVGDLIAFSDDMLSGEVNPTDWTTTRKSLLGEFTFHGNKVYVTANHWPAKGGSGEFWQLNQNLGAGDPDNSDWAQRNQVAQDVYSMLNLIQSTNANAGIVAGGDFNDFYFYRPLTTVTGYTNADGTARVGGARFDNLTLTLAEAERYTYTFDGRSQAIDHIIANQMLSGVATYDVVHLNTGYNSRGTGPNANPALSDHDPGLSSYDYRNFSETLLGTSGSDVIDGFGGNDVINGLGGADLLTGGAGADYLDGGGGGIDVLQGGTDNDTIIVDADDQVVEAAGGGYDNVAAKTSYVLGAGQEIEVLSTTNHGGIAAIDLTGNALGQVLIGNEGVNHLDGGGGADQLAGLGGNDIFVVDSDDRVYEAAGGGFDRLEATASFILGLGQEVEELATANAAGTGAINLGGNEFGQTLTGNAGANYLDGGGGTDILIGLGGDDTYIVNADDQVTEAASGGLDNVAAKTSYVLGAGQEIEVLSTTDHGGIAAINLTGNAFGQVVIGNAGANILDGGLGNDLLVGFGGADTFAFTTAPGAGNVDTIADFLGGTDKIGLDDAVFTGIGTPGAFNPNAFFAGAAAHDADDRIIYDSATGALYFDADGNGDGAMVQFATLTGLPVLAAGDFTVI